MKLLKKQSKNLKRKIKIKEFIKKRLWQYIIVIVFICFCGWLFNKPFESISLIVSHLYLRPKFDKQFHCIHQKRYVATICCLTLTCFIIFFGIMFILPLKISLLSSIPIAFLICWVGFIVQDRIELYENNKKNIYLMSDEEFKTYCKSKGLTDEEFQIAVFMFIKQLKGEQLYQKIGYSKRQTIRIKQKLIKLLNL